MIGQTYHCLLQKKFYPTAAKFFEFLLDTARYLCVTIFCDRPKLDHLLMKVSKFLRGPKSPPFPVRGSSFNDMLVEGTKARKRWHGQDKDAFFRDKYAHVHVKQTRDQPTKKALPSKVTQTPNNQFRIRLRQKLEKDKQLEYVYGTQAVKAVLQNRKVNCLYSGYNSNETDLGILKKCNELRIPVKTLTPLQHLNIMTSNSAIHNKYVAETYKRDIPKVNDLSISDNHIEFGSGKAIETRRNRPIGIYLDEITDPQNLGAILRNSYWFGADFVAISGRNSAPLSPTVVKASAGASEFIPIMEIPKPLQFFDNLRHQQWNIIASGPSKNWGLRSVPLNQLKELQGPLLVVVGSEGEGLRSSLAQRSTHSTMIPRREGLEIDSLNASVAAAFLLHSCI